MKILLKSAALAAIMFAASPQFALAAPATPSIVPGIGIANLEGIKVNSNAFRTAASQRPTTYKATYDAATARATQIQAQIKPLADKFEADRKLANPNRVALEQTYAQIQQLQQAGQQEINRMLMPATLSEAYVDEQILDKMQKAVEQAIAKRNITLLVTPDQVIFANPAYDMSKSILDELNVLLPAAALVPPAGWEPRQVREAKAQQAAQQAPAAGAPAAPARPAGPQPDGR